MRKVFIVCIISINLLMISCKEDKSVIRDSSPEKQKVLDAILRLHDGMRTKDGALAVSAWHEDASSYNINIAKDKTVKLALDTPEVNLENIKKWLDTTTDNLDEEIFDVEIFIDGHLAMAWIPYNFFRNETFTHSGTNAFTLVKVQGVWKIVSVTDTRYFQQ